MKLLKKVNRGLILTIAVLLAVAIYLVVLESAHSAAKPKIENICRDYIKTTTSYGMLPEKYRVDKPSISQTELDGYIDQMETALKSFYPNNEQISKYAVNTEKTSLTNQAKGKGTVYKYDRTILNFKSIKFDGNTATVTIQSLINYDGPQNANSPTRKTASGQATETIMLQQTDEKWKVVYASLQPVETLMSGSQMADDGDNYTAYQDKNGMG